VIRYLTAGESHLSKKILPDNIQCINDSYPSFFDDINKIGGEIIE